MTQRLTRTISPAEVQALHVSGGRLVKKRNKYGVADKSARTYANITYDSKREMKYAQELDVLKACGEVMSWDRQWPFPIWVAKKYICTVVIDFKVRYASDGHWEHHEVKGVETPVWRLKRKLLEACYPDVVLKVIK
jgi:hypothetical protein